MAKIGKACRHEIAGSSHVNPNKTAPMKRTADRKASRLRVWVGMVKML